MAEVFIWALTHQRAIAGCVLAFIIGMFVAGIIIEGPRRVWAELFATEGRTE
jgi:uncharacterized membrane protein YraQ (UPF0718 family)